ncbi:hypothetical protein B0G52_103230 [Cohnella sp. SGD-V74]|uniref:prenylated flavin chaperone LpdD n=1 Tax=unclassified Cohnella TaxID=2636738 RepID=UPI000B8C2BE4|nr:MULTISPECIES: hypothetical protein [unclassified Cohnella]PRX73633.1 hypothetical protein B0G52_103230 [Cohnella sp. SGD-V74]
MKSGRAENNRLAQVDIRYYGMGKDVVFLVTGGAAHIGATATACWSDKEGEAVHVDVLTLPGHREDRLAAELAVAAASALRRTVAVLAGIHLDRPSREDIEGIVREARRRMKQVLDEWEDRPEESEASGETIG